MVDLPRFTKLGAKWVEVKKRSGDKASYDESEFENVASNTRYSIAQIEIGGIRRNAQVASYATAGAGRPSTHCQLAIANCRWHSEMLR